MPATSSGANSLRSQQFRCRQQLLRTYLNCPRPPSPRRLTGLDSRSRRALKTQSHRTLRPAKFILDCDRPDSNHFQAQNSTRISTVAGADERTEEDADAIAPTLDEIEAYFEAIDFEMFWLGPENPAFYRQDLDLVARDARDGNFIRSKGLLVPIDVTVGKPTESHR